jgi:uroporphyrinogen decarboxylase
MRKEAMTPKERWQATLERRKPDRVPMDYWATPEVDQKLLRHLGCDDMWVAFKRLHIDRPVVVTPEYVGPPRRPGANDFGVIYQKVDYGTGVYDEAVYNPLAKYRSIAELEAEYTWPQPDWYDYNVLPAQLDGKEEYPVEGPFSEPYYLYKDLRGMEQSFIDLAENAEFVCYCLDKLFEYEYQRILRTFETLPGKVTYVQVGEDFGTQNGLMYSLEHIRKYFLPHMKMMMRLVNEGGAFVMTHCDGAIREVIPDLIEIGMDVLNPVQWRCKGMGREALKSDFGDKIIFHGAMDNQKTVPFGSPDDVRQEVLDNYTILGAGGGYILAPCHNLQAVTPAENILALYEAGYEHGWT